MSLPYCSLYTDMLADINRCQALELPETERVETCCRITMDYWEELKTIFQKTIDYAEEEEIYFFKQIKPRFTSHYEYYLIVNQALLFSPFRDADFKTYWEEEARRYNRFYEKNKEIISYFDTGRTEQDSVFFTRKHFKGEISPHERVYHDEHCRTLYDPVIRGLLANSMYHEYAYRKMQELGMENCCHPPLPLFHETTSPLFL